MLQCRCSRHRLQCRHASYTTATPDAQQQALPNEYPAQVSSYSIPYPQLSRLLLVRGPLALSAPATQDAGCSDVPSSSTASPLRHSPTSAASHCARCTLTAGGIVSRQLGALHAWHRRHCASDRHQRLRCDLMQQLHSSTSHPAATGDVRVGSC